LPECNKGRHGLHARAVPADHQPAPGNAEPFYLPPWPADHAPVLPGKTGRNVWADVKPALHLSFWSVPFGFFIVSGPNFGPLSAAISIFITHTARHGTDTTPPHTHETIHAGASRSPRAVSPLLSADRRGHHGIPEPCACLLR